MNLEKLTDKEQAATSECSSSDLLNNTKKQGTINPSETAFRELLCRAKKARPPGINRFEPYGLEYSYLRPRIRLACNTKRDNRAIDLHWVQMKQLQGCCPSRILPYRGRFSWSLSPIRSMALILLAIWEFYVSHH